MLNNTKTIGHRGVPSNEHVLENTYDSFMLAAKSEHDGIETDIWPTKDNNFVCVHDCRPFTHSFKKIYNYTAKQCIKKNLRSSFNYPRNKPGDFSPNSNKKNHPILLEKYLDICKEFNKTCFIELKNDAQWLESKKGIWTIERIDHLIDVLGNSKIDYKNIYLISLDNDLLMFIKKRFPFIQIMVIVDPNNKIVEYRDPAYFLNRGYSIDVGDFDSESTKDWGIKITPELIESFHNKNLLVGAWTVNTIERVELLSSWGIDFITSDYIIKK